MANQNAEILRLLKRRKSQGITQADAVNECGCWRLAARIHELRGMGYPIDTQIEYAGDDVRFARYVMGCQA